MIHCFPSWIPSRTPNIFLSNELSGILWPIPLSARSMAWVCCCSLAVIAGSIPVGDTDICLLWVLCIVRYSFLRRADHSSSGNLPSVVCLSVIVKLRKWGGPGPLGAVVPWTKKEACRLRNHSLCSPLLRTVTFPPCTHILCPAPLLKLTRCTNSRQ